MNELSKVADGVDGGQMKRAIPITTLFLDIGGVLLTNGWDHQCPQTLAAKTFNLNLDEMEDRHHLTFDTYEVGKAHAGGIPEPDGLLRGATVHAGSVSGIHVRAVATLS